MLAELIYSSPVQSSNCNLTVAIPTYNRIENLCLVLERLKVLQDIGIQIIVLDNSSSTILTEDFCQSFKSINNFKLYRNKLFTYADINILRVLEFVDTEYVYLLGDSKLPNAHALEIIKNDIESAQEVEGFIYSYDSLLKKEETISSINDLTKSGLTFGDLLLVGNSVFSNTVIRKYLSIAQEHAGSHAPLPVFSLCCLSDGIKIKLSNKIIIERFLQKPEAYNPGYALLDCWSGFPLLARLPVSDSDARRVVKFIRRNENLNSRINVLKLIILKIYREKKDVRRYIRNILSTRYIYSTFNIEKILMQSIFIFASTIFYYRSFLKKWICYGN